MIERGILLGRAARCGVAVLAVMAAVSPAAAQQQPPAPPAATASASGSVATARKLLGMMGVERTLDFVFIGLGPTFATATLGGLHDEPAVRELIEKGQGGQPALERIFSEEFLKSIRKQYPALLEKAAQQYAAAFTEAELNDLIAFYSSGTGKKALTILPKLQVDMSKEGEKLGQIAGMEAGANAFERARREMLPERGAPRI